MLAPKHLPDMALMLSDIAQPARAIAAQIGVTENTVYRWQRGDLAPRPAQLALFWETRWGISLLNCQAVNDARLYFGLSESFKRENAGLRARISYLERVGAFGAANEPICEPWRVSVSS